MNDNENPANDSQANEPFVSVLVPSDRVLDIYRFLSQPPAPVATESAPAAQAAGGWTEQLIRRMFKESGDPTQQMLRMLAKADGEEVSTNEIALALSLPKGASSVGGMAGALGRRVSSRYGMDGLPWETRWRYIDPTDDTKGTETLISLPKWACKVIREL